MRARRRLRDWSVFGLAMLQAWPVAAECPPPYAPAVLDPRLISAVTDSLACDVFEDRIQGQVVRAETSVSHGKLTARWAQQSVGSDLVSGFMQEWDSQNPQKATLETRVGIIDTGVSLSAIPTANLSPELVACRPDPVACHIAQIEEHGTNVANLIVGAFGSSSRSRIAGIATASIGSTIGQAADRVMAGPNPPTVVNLSMYQTNETWARPAEQESLRRLGERAVLVKASGNFYPDPMYRMNAEAPGIVVGSLAPNGLMSAFSNEGDSVTISAPSNTEVLSRSGTADGGTRISRFSGTSGATPLVTGAVANVQSFLPGAATNDLKELLRRTAIVTSGFRPSNGKNGAGALNSYKLARVAARLSAAGWPASRSRLADPSIYDFSQEAETLRGQAIAKLESPTCSDKREGLAALRRAYFLRPEDPAIRGLLSRLYREHGFEEQAQYVEADTAARTAPRTVGEPGRFTAYLRAGLPAPPTMAVAAYETLDPTLAGTSARRGFIAGVIRMSGAAAAAPLVRALAGRMSPAVADGMRTALDGLNPPDASLVIRAAFEGATNPEIRESLILTCAIKMGLDVAANRPVVEAALRDPSPKVRFGLAHVLDQLNLDPATCRSYADRLKSDADSMVRDTAALRCGARSP